jgi:hypothetical protein
VPDFPAATPVLAATRLVRLLRCRGQLGQARRIQTIVACGGLETAFACETALVAAWPGPAPDHELIWSLPGAPPGRSGFTMSAHDAHGRRLAGADGLPPAKLGVSGHV